MNVSEIFIRRPVMTTLVMAAFLLAGLFGYSTLPVSELPTIDFPTVNVMARLPGANAETVATSLATPLEKNFSTIPGVESMSSSSSQGFMRITLTFKLERNIDAAAQDVQAMVSATGGLPRDMPAPPVVRKQNPGDAPIMIFNLTSTTLPTSVIDAYVENIVVPRLATIDGVAQVEIQGQSRQAVRIQVDPNALAARGIGIDQVAAAIRATNVNQGTGSLDGATRQMVIQTQGQLMDAAAFRRQIVAYRDGAPVRLFDIATVIDSVENVRQYSTFNGLPAISLRITRQPGANTIAVSDQVNAQLPDLRRQLPSSITLDQTFDRSQSIRAAIHDVQITLIFSAVLVVGVIFMFLRSLSATFIPSIALPIAIIGAFAGMAALGYSLDNLSLMALTLSVIFIVDDAIVMLENVMRHIEAGETPLEAALKGSREVSSTILTMTISLAAVFIPVLFMSGILGRLLNEFAVTIVLAILVSGVVSVTLTPMLCSRILKAKYEEKESAFHRRTEAAFDWLLGGYERSLRWALRHRPFIMMLFFASLVATVLLFRVIPQDFLPSDDVGNIQGGTLLANGTSYEDAVRHQEQVEDIIRADPDVNKVSSFINGGRQGGLSIRLKPRAEREHQAGIDEIMARLRRAVANIPGISVFMQNPPSIRLGGIQTRSAYQYTLTGADRQELYAAAEKLRIALQDAPGIVDVNSDLDLTTPSIDVTIDRDAAASLGVSVQQIETALGSAFGGGQISTIYTSADQYQVILELLPQYQRDPTALSRLYLTGTDGTLVPLTSVTKRATGVIGLSENHLAQLPAVTISFGLQPGVPLSQAVDTLEEVKLQVGVPASITGGFQGTAQAFQESMKGMGFLLLAGILVVYIVLGILYESFVHPITILSGLPSAAAGALATLGAWHMLYVWGYASVNMSLTLYAYVGMIMLIGIVKKNAIMMIDFALTRQRNDDIDAESAIFEAALVRFRPIMMTTMAALVGAVPIAMGLGAGGEGRRPLGVAVVGGLLVSQLLTLYITPVIYNYLDALGARLTGRQREAVPAQAE